MSNIKRELDKVKIPDSLHEKVKLGVKKARIEKRKEMFQNFRTVKRLSVAVAVCIVAVSTLTFTPVFATLQGVIDELFSTNHIDDSGLRSAVTQGQGQIIDQTYYDEKNDITVHFESIMTDDKETKLLFTYRSEKTNLKDFYVDIFEGVSSISLIVGDEKKKLDNVGWGSRHYVDKENKVVEALSFEPIKEYKGQKLRLEINDLTIWAARGPAGTVKAEWPIEFTLEKSAIIDRETVELNKQFNFQGQSYTIKKVEYSNLETRVVITGTDTKIQTDENGEEYSVLSELEQQFLNARKIDKEFGYIVDEKKSGVFLSSAGEKVEPIFSKGEVEGEKDEYIMIFAPVKNRQDCILEIGEEIKVPLNK